MDSTIAELRFLRTDFDLGKRRVLLPVLPPSKPTAGCRLRDGRDVGAKPSDTPELTPMLDPGQKIVKTRNPVAPNSVEAGSEAEQLYEASRAVHRPPCDHNNAVITG
ncbi:hypothetical protein ABZ345_46710 [Lentzea sp. NPDC005914]|uniref:hypothetical protein n=1 Tax=Lentzea sp. NPDC005914 TaxID=3154572 RepID=UPI0033F51AD0